MPKTLKVLENLESNLKKERENIYQLHQESLRRLETNLTKYWKNKLNTMAKDIQEATKAHIRKTYKMVWIYGIASLLIGLTIGALGGILWEKRAIGKENWILSKKEWRYGKSEQDGMEWFQREIPREGR